MLAPQKTQRKESDSQSGYWRDFARAFLRHGGQMLPAKYPQPDRVIGYTIVAGMGVVLFARFLHSLFGPKSEQGLPLSEGQQLEETLNSCLSQFVAMNQRATDARLSVGLNFDEMNTMYEKHGERGLYAYLCQKNLVKDYHHGQFIIKDIFLPERERRTAPNVVSTSPFIEE